MENYYTTVILCIIDIFYQALILSSLFIYIFFYIYLGLFKQNKLFQDINSDFYDILKTISFVTPPQKIERLIDNENKVLKSFLKLNTSLSFKSELFTLLLCYYLSLLQLNVSI